MRFAKHRPTLLITGLFAIMLTIASCQTVPILLSSAMSDASAGAADTHEGNGLVTVASDSSVAETTERLEAALRERGLIVVAVIDHAANAENAGFDLRPTRLIITGNPNLGTPLMQESQTVAIDLPQKFLIWEDENGDVFVGYNDPKYLAGRHNITGQDSVLETVANALANFAQRATTSPTTE